MSTTNGWDLVCGFNQFYLNDLAAYLYDSGKFPHTYVTNTYNLELEQPSLTFSGVNSNALAMRVSFQGTQAGAPIEGYLNIEVDVSKLGSAYVGQKSYLQMDGGASEFADCGDSGSITSKGCTLEAWINTSVTTPQNILVFGQGAPSLSLAADRLGLYWGGANNSTDATPVSDGRWHHVAAVVQDNKITFYKDGQAKGQVSLFGGSMQSSSGNLQLGMAGGGNSAFSGYMTEVRVWNVARTAQEIQQAMNVHLSGSEDGLLGYWRFADGAGVVKNQVNKQAGSLNGGAEISVQSSPDYASYTYFFDPDNMFTVTSNVTTGTTTGDNQKLDLSVLNTLKAFASVPRITPSTNPGAIIPTTINFLTLKNASDPNADQFLSIMMTGNRMPPSGDPGAAFAGNTPIMIPSGSNSVVAVWDYLFFNYIVAPALTKMLDVPSSEVEVTQDSPSVLTFSGEAALNKLQVVLLKMFIQSEGIYIGLQGYLCNGIIALQLEATLSAVVKEDSSSGQAAPEKAFLSFKKSPLEGSSKELVLTLPDTSAEDSSSSSIVFTLKDPEVVLQWNQQNPAVQDREEVMDALPLMGLCLTQCYRALLVRIQKNAVKKANDWLKDVTLDNSGKFKLNEINFNDGIILFGTLSTEAADSRA